jgi:ankyrin repeat protein
VGDEAAVQQAAANDPAWVNRAGGPLRLPPLVAVAHSSLLQLPGVQPRLLRCARQLLQAGADPNQRIGSRWPPGTLAAPDDSNPLSALYGAAGQNHDLELTRLLLEAGADPNDGESLYHSLDAFVTTGILLEHGARIPEAYAMYKVLDTENVAALALLLQHGGNPNEPARNAPTSDSGSPLMWAIRRRRSRRCRPARGDSQWCQRVPLRATVRPERGRRVAARTRWRRTAHRRRAVCRRLYERQ